MKNKIAILFVLALITSSCELNETEEVLPKMSLEEMMQYETKQDKERRISMGFLLKKEVHLMFGDRGTTYVKAIVEFEENNLRYYPKNYLKLGSKNKEPIKQSRRSMGSTICDDLFNIIDSNSDGCISISEWPFISTIKKFLLPINTFEAVDQDGNGCISRSEWGTICIN